MATKEEWKKRVIEAIEKRSAEMTAIGETLLHIPEMGFKEVKTAALVEEKFRSMGLTYRKGLSIKKNYRPKYTKDEYLKKLTQFSQSA
jgi:metal-dependent amidase/aminoacylase/carboxypeptidase family protein